jgi:signal peptidase I
MRMYEKSNFRIALTFILVALLGFATRTYFFSIRMVEGNSMNPTLHDGDFVLVNMWSRDFSQGDIAIFRPQGSPITLIKRIMAKPESIFYIDDYTVYINQGPLGGKKNALKDAISLVPESVEGKKYFTQWKLDTIDCRYSDILRSKKDEFIMIGDNRCESSDSRVFGPIPRKEMVGKIIKSFSFHF